MPKLIQVYVSRSYEVQDGPESATAESVDIRALGLYLGIRWKSAEDGRTPCLYVTVGYRDRYYDLISRAPKFKEDNE